MPAVKLRVKQDTIDAEDRQAAWRGAAERSAPPLATLVDAARLCRELAEDVGAEGFGLFFLAAASETKRLAPVFDSAFPGISPLTKSLSGRAAEGFARSVAEACAPLWWRPAGEPPFLSAAARCWAVEIDSPAQGSCGLVFPVAGERGRGGAVILHGEGMVLDEAQLCDTHARCVALFAEVARQRMQDCAKAPPVSKREIECLRLTANGLTSEEIAASLGLSVHTANQYLTNSTHKLNAVNRIHAVAKALRGGLID